eukprot:8548017-Heterocapsa_arctica.AAC.1
MWCGLWQWYIWSECEVDQWAWGIQCAGIRGIGVVTVRDQWAWVYAVGDKWAGGLCGAGDLSSILLVPTSTRHHGCSELDVLQAEGR